MSLNLGPEAFEAIRRLKNNSDWRAVVAGLHEQMNNFMHRALETPVDDRQDATGYARGLRDIRAHIELVEEQGTGASRNPKPGVRVRESGNV
jgi:hypothetical protein